MTVERAAVSSRERVAIVSSSEAESEPPDNLDKAIALYAKFVIAASLVAVLGLAVALSTAEGDAERLEQIATFCDSAGALLLAGEFVSRVFVAVARMRIAVVVILVAVGLDGLLVTLSERGGGDLPDSIAALIAVGLTLGLGVTAYGLVLGVRGRKGHLAKAFDKAVPAVRNIVSGVSPAWAFPIPAFMGVLALAVGLVLKIRAYG